MLSEQAMEKIAERLAFRMEEVNIYTLEIIGKRIKEIGTASKTDLKKILFQVQNGSDLDKIMNKLAEMTNLNIKDIYQIFEDVAKSDLNASKMLYKYKEIQFIPFEENQALKRQIKALAKVTAETYLNLSKTTAFGILENNKIKYYNLSEAYQNVIDKALISLEQGQDVFNHAMYKAMNDLGNGIKVVDYTTGYHRRLDTAVRMNILDAIRDVHNETEKILGEEIGADGVEITVHENPAPDHAPVQGRQFSIKEFKKLQNGESFKDVNGTRYQSIERNIGQWNCYHTINNILIGVSKPQYTEAELKQIRNKNNTGFEFEGKHYTNYEGTQLQRRLETEIRRQKDKQIIGKASSNKELINKSQQRITLLTRKYRELCKISGLNSKLERARVQNYHRINVDRL